jgi:hypothetical protein
MSPLFFLIRELHAPSPPMKISPPMTLRFSIEAAKALPFSPFLFEKWRRLWGLC